MTEVVDPAVTDKPYFQEVAPIILSSGTARRHGSRHTSAGPVFTGHFVTGMPIGKIAADILFYAR
jgi:hypothetical protein